MAQVWMASRFDLWGTFARLRKWYGLRVGRNYGIRYLKAALYEHLPEIREYVMATKKIDLDEYFEKFHKNIEWLENVRDGNLVDANLEPAKLAQRLEAANTVERGAGRMITVFTEADKRAEATKTADASQGKFFNILEKIAEKNGGVNPDEEPASS